MLRVKEPCQNNCCSSNTQEAITPSNIQGKRLSWAVSGMDCPACARKIENAVKGLEGVLQTRVTFATERLLVVVGDDNAEQRQRILAAVHQAGFKIDSHNDNSPLSTLNQNPLNQNLLQRYWRILALASLIASAIVIRGVFPVAGNALFYTATLWGLFPVSKQALKLAKSGSPFSIEMLMSMAALGALFLGETVEAAMVLLLFSIGEHLEAFAAANARRGVQKLMELTPDTALKITPDGNKEEVPVSVLFPGDLIEVLPGNRLPVDAELLTANTSFDESALTGESIPVDHDIGDNIMAGCLSVDRPAQLKVISEPGASAVDRIIQLIEEAEERKAPVERFIDAFSRWYTPLMMMIAALVAMIPPLMMDGLWHEWLYKALALLLIACPCALVISTPAAVTSALATASRNGALVKGGLTLEQLGSVTTVAFDKTGTLTEGKPTVTCIHALKDSEDNIIRLAAAIEQISTHPLAKAIVNEANRRNLNIPLADHSQTKTGLGVEGVVEHQTIVIGSPKHQKEAIKRAIDAAEGIQSTIEQFEAQGNTLAVVTIDGQLVGLIALRDNLRSEAKEAIQALKRQGIISVMLTGDNARTAGAIATELDIHYQAELLPADKSLAVENLQKQGKVAMIGDGINDAPALKAAEIGIAMGGGADIALETADAALTHNRITELAGLVELSRSTMAIIHQNIALAIGSKAIFLMTTLLGVTGLWAAVLADTGATAIVTLNALRLLRRKL